MPTTNYLSPGSLAPQMPAMPPGALAGAFQAKQEQNYDQMMHLQKMLVEYQRRREEEELTQGRPVRDAQRGAQTAQHGLAAMLDRNRMATPGFSQAMIGGQMGEAQTKQAAGQHDMATVGSKIDMTRSDNDTKMAGNRFKQLESHLDTYGMAFANIPNLDQGQAQKAYGTFKMGLPNGLKELFPEQYDQSVPARIKAVREHITKNSAHMRQVDLEQVQGTEQRKNTELTNAGNLKVAQERAHAKNKTYQQMLQEALLLKDDNAALRAARMIIADPDADPQLVQKAKAAEEQARRNLAARAERGSFTPGDLRNPNALGNRIEQRLGGEGGAPNAPSTGGYQGPVYGRTKEGYLVISPKGPDGSVQIIDPKTGRKGRYKP